MLMIVYKRNTKQQSHHKWSTMPFKKLHTPCFHAKLIVGYAQGIRIDLTRVDQGKTTCSQNELSSHITLKDNAYTHHQSYRTSTN